MTIKKRRCRICRAEEGKQHKMSCTFDRYQAWYPSTPVYVDDPGSDSSSSSCSSSSDSGSSGGCE